MENSKLFSGQLWNHNNGKFKYQKNGKGTLKDKVSNKFKWMFDQMDDYDEQLMYVASMIGSILICGYLGYMLWPFVIPPSVWILYKNRKNFLVFK